MTGLCQTCQWRQHEGDEGRNPTPKDRTTHDLSLLVCPRECRLERRGYRAESGGVPSLAHAEVSEGGPVLSFSLLAAALQDTRRPMERAYRER